MLLCVALLYSEGKLLRLSCLLKVYDYSVGVDFFSCNNTSVMSENMKQWPVDAKSRILHQDKSKRHAFSFNITTFQVHLRKEGWCFSEYSVPMKNLTLLHHFNLRVESDVKLIHPFVEICSDSDNHSRMEQGSGGQWLALHLLIEDCFRMREENVDVARIVLPSCYTGWQFYQLGPDCWLLWERLWISAGFPLQDWDSGPGSLFQATWEKV